MLVDGGGGEVRCGTDIQPLGRVMVAAGLRGMFLLEFPFLVFVFVVTSHGHSNKFVE